MPASRDKARALFLHAVGQLPPERWDGYVAEAAGGDAELERQVRQLLQVHQEAGSFLDRPAEAVGGTGEFLPALAAGGTSVGPGTVIGPYTLREQIGEGGMGLVFVAEQQHPVRRKVALKVIKPGMDSAQVLARFEAERQALALMDHPNIARVFDAGATEAGRPYFVMELVKGVPVTDYCDQHRLTTRERLGLFLQVCQAVQHAHTKGIIHRDLKPCNVLVAVHDVTAVVKVIDFGVAKATGQQLTDRTLYTGFAQLVGTPLYMSPEQAGSSSLDIDTRSDVYSLGVLLYELLTGTTPFEAEALKRAGYDEMRRMIREDEPPRPSARISTLEKVTLSTLAERRGIEPCQLGHEVRGELDWVVMKALEKDRNRRYDTASALARDVQRYLDDDVVEARPPSASYRLHKALRRNKGLVLAAVLLLLALSGGVVGTSLGIVQAERRRQEARDERDRAVEAEADTKAFADFLSKHVLAATRPEGVQGGVGINVTMAQALRKAEPALGAVFQGRPKAEALARHAIGVTWRSLGRYLDATQHLERALELRQEALGPDHPDTLTTIDDLALAYQGAGKDLAFNSKHSWILQRNVPLCEQALAKREENLGPNHPATLTAMNKLASAYQAAKKRDEAVQILEEVLARRQRSQGPDHPDTLTSICTLALAYRDAGKPDTVVGLHKVTLAYRDPGKLDKALRILEQALAKKEKLGRDHPDMLSIMDTLASAYKDSGELDKALSLLEQVMLGRNQKLGPEHPHTQQSMERLGRAYLVMKQTQKALPLLRDFLAGQKKWFADDDPRLASIQASVAVDLLKAGLPAEAEPIFRECLAIREKKHKPDDWMTFHTRSLLGASLLGQKKYADAEPLLLTGYEGLKKDDGKVGEPYLAAQSIPLVRLNQREFWISEQFHRAHLTEALERVVRLYEATGKTDEAARWRKQLEERTAQVARWRKQLEEWTTRGKR